MLYRLIIMRRRLEELNKPTLKHDGTLYMYLTEPFGLHQINEISDKILIKYNLHILTGLLVQHQCLVRRNASLSQVSQLHHT